MKRPVRSHFFSPVWLYSAGVLLLFGMIIRQPAVSLLAASVFITAGLCWLWTRYALEGLIYSRYLSETRAFRGELLTITFKLENRSWIPLAWVEIDEHISDRVRPIETESLPSDRVGSTTVRHASPLRWKQRITWTINLECLERGLHTVGPTTIRSGDPFGFFTARKRIENQATFLVYPDVVPLPEYSLPLDFPLGGHRIPHHLLTDPVRVIGVRDYAPDDSIRHMHWKASACLQRPQVKVFEPTVDLQVAIYLSLDTFERYWEGMDSIRAESGIIAAASMASEMLNQRATVGMSVNAVISGSDQTLRIPPGRGPRQLEAILEGLARLSPMASSSFPRLLVTESLRIPSGSTIVVIACIMTDALEIALQELISRGQRVVLVRIGEIRIPPLPKLHVMTVPGNISVRQHQIRHRYARVVRSGAIAHD